LRNAPYINGNQGQISGAGSSTVTVKQPGNNNFSSAPDLPRLYPIAKASAQVNLDPQTLAQLYDCPTTLPTLTGSYLIDFSQGDFF